MGIEWTGARRRIAVVGSGIAGLSAAWLLSQRHRVTLFERAARLGGHSNTVDVDTPYGRVAVDTGFIVYNEANYPNLTALLAHLDVETMQSDMSFGASIGGGAVEYSSVSVNGFLGQRGNLVRPRFYAMVRDILRFYRAAPKLLADPACACLSLGDYLDAEGYSAAFVEDHLLPMGAAIWSTTARDMRAYPLRAFVGFFTSHGLLELIDRPLWRTVAGGSRAYVERLSDGLDVRLGARLSHIRRHPGHVELVSPQGSEHFDDVVLATHADEALALLADPAPGESQLLGAFRYTDNLAVLHSDAALMPKRRRVWASWNYIGEPGGGDDRQLCVTYWMNKLQNIDSRVPLFVTLNPTRPVAPGLMHQAIAYTHPLFDGPAMAAQRNLWSLQGANRTWFCGSYFGHGFHEDALQSGLAVAEALGGTMRPWGIPDAPSRIAGPQELVPAE